MLTNKLIIAGPCSIEDEEQMTVIADKLSSIGVCALRGGAFKPRTSPNSFQGLGIKGLDILYKVGKTYNLPIVSELVSTEYLDLFLDKVDVIQVGSRNMYNYELLKVLGEVDKTILLKRHFSATIDEFLSASEYITSRGNKSVILCERGIRSFDNITRNVLDVGAIAVLKRIGDLPIIADPSHATGRRDIIPQISKSALAAGADGLMIECHPKPDESISDSQQAFPLDKMNWLINDYLVN
jgi:3-deoxy-7-phosphoheptulonate synthase